MTPPRATDEKALFKQNLNCI